MCMGQDKDGIGITFEKLIRRLEERSRRRRVVLGGYNCGYAVLQGELNRLSEGMLDRRGSIRGMVWGLFMVDFISEEERDLLLDQLTAMYREV